MPRFCLERTDAPAAGVVIHAQDCSSYDLASLLAEGRICDMGVHDNAASALKAMDLAERGDAVFCYHCCHFTRATPVKSASAHLGPRYLPVTREARTVLSY